MNSTDTSWLASVESAVRAFASAHGSVYARSYRTVSAAFEVGCFLSLVRYYEDRECSVEPENLKNGSFRYLTTPAGNPSNFSHVSLSFGEEAFEIRQQVRVQAEFDPDIAFTPDIVVLKASPTIRGDKLPDYAGGKKRFFAVAAREVIAAHECKSTNPFPELLISFIGMLITAHAWLDSARDRTKVRSGSLHLAPTLFVGGFARGVQLRMISALQRAHPINIVLGVHAGNWRLAGTNLTCIGPL